MLLSMIKIATHSHLHKATGSEVYGGTSMRFFKDFGTKKHGGGHDRDFDFGDFCPGFFWSHSFFDCWPGHPAQDVKIAYRSADGSQNNKYDVTLNAAGT